MHEGRFPAWELTLQCAAHCTSLASLGPLPSVLCLFRSQKRVLHPHSATLFDRHWPLSALCQGACEGFKGRRLTYWCVSHLHTIWVIFCCISCMHGHALMRAPLCARKIIRIIDSCCTSAHVGLVLGVTRLSCRTSCTCSCTCMQ